MKDVFTGLGWVGERKGGFVLLCCVLFLFFLGVGFRVALVVWGIYRGIE